MWTLTRTVRGGRGDACGAVGGGVAVRDVGARGCMAARLGWGVACGAVRTMGRIVGGPTMSITMLRVYHYGRGCPVGVGGCMRRCGGLAASVRGYPYGRLVSLLVRSLPH